MIAPQDFDRLSAYLDHQLSPRETAALEARLAREPELQTTLDDLRANARLLRALPTLKPPRSFTLTRAQAPARASFRLFPAMRLASALASTAFIVVLATDLWTAMRPASAPAAEVPAAEYASDAAPTDEGLSVAVMGNGAEAPGTPTPEMPIAALKQTETETPTPEGGDVARTASIAPTETPQPMAESMMAVEATPSEEAMLAASASPASLPAPDRSLWMSIEIGLAALALLCAAAAWVWRKR